MEFKDYQKIGSELKELNELLVDHIVETSKKVRKSSPEMKHADKTMKTLRTLRSELEEMMFIEHREECHRLGEKALHIFYGERESRQVKPDYIR